MLRPVNTQSLPSLPMGLYNDLVGAALKVGRSKVVIDGQPATQDEFLTALSELLGLPKKHRLTWRRYERGMIVADAALLLAVADVSGVGLDELLVEAVGQLVHDEYVEVKRLRKRMRSRTFALIRKLRTVGAADHPERGSTGSAQERSD